MEEHFPVKGKTIEMPNGATKEVIDYKLSRYACYLIIQNDSPARHKYVALGQTYFLEKKFTLILNYDMII